ncbi:MAG: hypothetical protein WCG86_04175 [Actinomycetota bacterium]
MTGTRHRWLTLSAALLSLGSLTFWTSPSRADVEIERARAGWSVVSTSERGVMVDQHAMYVDGALFIATRFRKTTTALHWHTGSTDPRGAAARLAADSGPRIDWSHEGAVGVIGAFNGGFKQSDLQGGTKADGILLQGLVVGDATIGINTQGQVGIGVWGRDFPSASFSAISYRQNLTLLVDHGAIPVRVSQSPSLWGKVITNYFATPRSALGVDALGNVVYLASMNGVLPLTVARALVAVGVVSGLQLDINPYWPILGLSTTRPLHRSTDPWPYRLPGSAQSPKVYSSGWSRDFFVVLANGGRCLVSTPGLTKGASAQPVSAICP